MRYRPEIDGLRAVAVLPVIFFHAGVGLFAGGYVGVDVFFVISGFLITTILLDELQEGRFSLLGFWERRIRRILPALFTVVAASSIAAVMLMNPAELQRYSKSVLSVATFWSNIHFWDESGYFDTTAELKPLLHTWSLAVEEQYYILFPPFLAIIWAFCRRWLLPILIILFVVSLAVSQWTVDAHPAFAFFWLPARSFELGVGVFVALYFQRRDAPGTLVVRECLSIAGLGLILASILLFDDETPFPGLYALVPTVGTGLVILTATSGTRVHRLLSARPLVGIGLISYSAYLWHQPLFAYARIATKGEASTWTIAALTIPCLCLAALSWRFVEKPFRRRADIGRSRLFKAAAVMTAALVAISVGGMTTHGYRNLLVKIRLSPDDAARYRIVEKSVAPDFVGTMFDDGACRIWIEDMRDLLSARVEKCFEHEPPPIVVFGDSHGMNLYAAVAKSNLSSFVIGAAQPGCRVRTGPEPCDLDSFGRFLQSYGRRIGALIFHQSGSYFVEDENGELSDQAAFDTGRYELRPDIVTDVARNLENLGKRYGIGFLWVGPFTEYRRDPLTEAFRGGSLMLNPTSERIFEKLDPVVADIAEKFGRIDYVPFSHLFEVPTDLVEGECFLFRDADHFSRCGESVIARSESFRRFLGKLIDQSKHRQGATFDAASATDEARGRGGAGKSRGAGIAEAH
ncbi:acyltransferase family protein [Jiella pacifica]|uniref:Acyltransferase family protein n=1 Tax=Jiella pacifica TaxID=2696469 RepID=A0A6N9SW56_9HYPH|nr:acyltransferase family protein [Jiella pacifica]NDW03283.1 acyltransferase family protein [Jiella pacifica]